MDMLAAAINFILGGQPEPIDWEMKRLADDQRVRRAKLQALTNPPYSTAPPAISKPSWLSAGKSSRQYAESHSHAGSGART